jgi:hypothetical protein
VASRAGEAISVNSRLPWRREPVCNLPVRVARFRDRNAIRGIETMAEFRFTFNRDLASDAEVIGVRNPTDRQLFAQIRKEFAGTVLAEIVLDEVVKESDEYRIIGRLDHEGPAEELASVVQREVYDKDFSAGSFSIEEHVPTMRR